MRPRLSAVDLRLRSTLGDVWPDTLDSSVARRLFCSGSVIAVDAGNRSGRRRDVGLQREHNEDSFVVLKEYDLFVVADGMGGHRAGDVASKLATETISEFFKSTANDDVTWPFHFDTNLSEEENRLLTGIRVANRQIFERSDALARVPRHGHDGRGRHVQPAQEPHVHRPRR